MSTSSRSDAPVVASTPAPVEAIGSAVLAAESAPVGAFDATLTLAGYKPRTLHVQSLVEKGGVARLAFRAAGAINYSVRLATASPSKGLFVCFVSLW